MTVVNGPSSKKRSDSDALYLPDDHGQPGTTIATYGYDGLGRRISNNPAGGTVDYYYNENYQVIEVRKNGDSDAYEQYVWDQRYIDAPVMVYRDTNTDGTVDQKLYVAQDANFNVTATVNGDSGSVVNRFVYTPYGQRTVLTATWTAGTTDFTLGHQGLMLDYETGMYYNRARFYHPTLGRFIQRDPLGYVDGGSLYGCYSSRPTSGRDPHGLRDMDTITGRTGAGTGTSHVRPPIWGILDEGQPGYMYWPNMQPPSLTNSPTPVSIPDGLYLYGAGLPHTNSLGGGGGSRGSGGKCPKTCECSSEENGIYRSMLTVVKVLNEKWPDQPEFGTHRDAARREYAEWARGKFQDEVPQHVAEVRQPCDRLSRAIKNMRDRIRGVRRKLRTRVRSLRKCMEDVTRG